MPYKYREQKRRFAEILFRLDCFCYPTNHRVVWSLTDLHSHDPVTEESVILVEVHPSIPGTVYLRLIRLISMNRDTPLIVKFVERNHRMNMYIRHNGIIKIDKIKSSHSGLDFANGFACGQ